jgi:hypothetical protein
VADYFQGAEQGGDEEVIFFSGEADQGAAADCKPMKMPVGVQLHGVLGASVVM